VIIKDVEEKDGRTTNSVARHLVLPLPRTFDEAADWGGRCKKGSRIYAMYPQTTSLYSGTVVDNTTYCRGDDDIIVVEFDEDEHDATGSVKQYHIPARFVTLIPREFPASNHPNKKKSSAVTLQRRRSSTKPSSHKRGESSDSALDDMLDQFYGEEGNDNGKGGGEADFDLLLGFEL